MVPTVVNNTEYWTLPVSVLVGEFVYKSEGSLEEFGHPFKLEVSDNCCEGHAFNKGMEILKGYVDNYNNNKFNVALGDSVRLEVKEN